MIKGASGNKFSANLSKNDSEFKRSRMNTIGDVPFSAKLAHPITEPPPNCRSEKNVCLFVNHISNSKNHVVRPNEFFFHQKILHISIEIQKKHVS